LSIKAGRLRASPAFLSPAHELNNLDSRPALELRSAPSIPLDDRAIELYRDAFGLQMQRVNDIEKRAFRREKPALAVDCCFFFR
jgi:hypothetical protein